MFNKTTFSFLYMLLLVVLPLTFSSGVTYYIYQNVGLVTALGWEGWTMFFAATIFTMAFALTPTTLVALISGFFLGISASLYVIPAYLAASLIGFYAAGWIDRGGLIHTVSQKPKVALFLENLKQKEFSLIIMSRLSPVLPFALMNFVLSAMQVSLKNFLIAGFLGMLPRTLLFIWVGAQASALQEALENPNEKAYVQLIIVGLVVFTVFGIMFLIGRAIKKAGIK